jgi:hypothetical protein
MESWIDRQMEKHRNIETGRWRYDREVESWIYRQLWRWTNGNIDREIKIKRHTERHSQRDGDTKRCKERQKHRDAETERRRDLKKER